MTYVYAFDHQHELPLAEVAALIGGKAANLGVMVNELHLPVPPGFTISTSACRTYLAGGWPDDLDDEIRDHMDRLQKAVGRRFGDPADPLLVSVRSGAPVSMPGMMDTILNLGLNDATAAGMAEVTGDPVFVDACRRRFTGTYREIVGVAEVPDDPWLQLREAIEAVFRSWNSDRARSYRAREGIPDDLGTGVTVQAMVFGNRGPDSATGVLFTRNPATGERTLYGDVMFDAQGEDVVAGTHHTEPIAVLDERLPAVAAELLHHADVLERHYADVCDIEFTIEAGKLWMLQTRIGKRSPQAALRIAVDMAEDPEFPLSPAEAVRRVAHHLVDPPRSPGRRSADARVLARGLGASPGLASGAIATAPDQAVEMAEAGHRVILVRTATSPDDVHGMAKSAGILTSSGGLASHAAVVARGWGIPAVVGAAAVQVEEGTVSVGERHLAAGEVITIDGATGEVFAGTVAGSMEIIPEAATLLSWADRLGIDIGRPEGADRKPPAPAEIRPAGEPAVEALVRVLVIKGFATPEDLAAASLTSPDEAALVLNRMAADGLVELAGGMFAPTADGKALGEEMLAADRRQWGEEKAVEALDSFLPLDQRVKSVVTAWQMRELDGQPVLNDHSDREYDRMVLADFDALHRDAAAWLESISGHLARIETYAARLERAAARTREGDHRYIASPTVDSYHTVWFELHEDLILLAGRNRAEEVAAGRA